MLLTCTKCKHVQYVPDKDYKDYEDRKKFNAHPWDVHPYTCDGDSHTIMIPVSEVHILNIDPDKIDKFDLRNGDEWVFQMYKQFGFTDKENLFQMGKEDTDWLRKFKWKEECEIAFVQAVIEKNKSAAKRIGIKKLKHDLAWLSLDVGPGILPAETVIR